MKNNSHSFREFETLFNNHKIDALGPYFAKDVVITRGDGETHVGPSLILDFLQELVNSYPNARVSVNRMQTLERNAVIAEWYFSGSQSESGRVGEGLTQRPGGKTMGVSRFRLCVALSSWST